MSPGPAGADPAARAARLRWRCRRGMRELDQLLGRGLDRLLAAGDDEGLDRFERLLDCEDDQLWRWCLGQGRPDDAGLAGLVDALRADPAA